ncbi:MAG: hypothetical protein IAE78_25780 [Myxococcus sp.]|nr:hypothetical protein [Myxococcus sp.]
MLPRGLRTAFIVHFIADVVFAVPLFFAPVQLLTALGWHAVDPLATRLVAAALFGIGIQSWLGRDEPREAFKAMLNLKVIWSAAATLGLIWSMLDGGPMMGWAFVAIFSGFHLLWLRYRLLLG